MKFVSVSVALLFCCTAAFAEGGSTTSSGDGRSVRSEAPKADNVPAGGCMPIGLTARGELVFPMQCRELLDRERGPAADGQTSGVPQTTQPVVQQDVAAQDQARYGAPAVNLSAVRHRKKLPPHAQTAIIGAAAKKP